MRGELRKGLSGLIGKRIQHILVTLPNDSIERAFLIFDDGTCYEFYGQTQIDGSSAVIAGTLEEVRAWVGGAERVDLEI